MIPTLDEQTEIRNQLLEFLKALPSNWARQIFLEELGICLKCGSLYLPCDCAAEDDD